MKLKALKPLHHDIAGYVPVDGVADIPEPWASRYIERGDAERYETKVIRQEPTTEVVNEHPDSGKPEAKPAGDAQRGRRATAKPAGRRGS